MDDYSETEAKVDQLQVEIQQERSRRLELEADMEEVAAILSHLLMVRAACDITTSAEADWWVRLSGFQFRSPMISAESRGDD